MQERSCLPIGSTESDDNRGRKPRICSTEHQPLLGRGTYDKLEWIDDTSLNLVFGSEGIAHEALVALASVHVADATQLPPLEPIPAKSFSGKPDSTLSVRVAVTGDRKVAGAAQRSCFYLLHPEYDPEERKRRGDTRGKYRDP